MTQEKIKELAKKWLELTAFEFMSTDQIHSKEDFIRELSANQENLLGMVNDAASKLWIELGNIDDE